MKRLDHPLRLRRPARRATRQPKDEETQIELYMESLGDIAMVLIVHPIEQLIAILRWILGRGH